MYTQGKQFLYGDTAEVLREGQDIIELIGGEKKDPWLQYGTKKYSVINNDDHPIPNGKTLVGRCITRLNVNGWYSDVTSYLVTCVHIEKAI